MRGKTHLLEAAGGGCGRGEAEAAGADRLLLTPLSAARPGRGCHSSLRILDGKKKAAIAAGASKILPYTNPWREN